MNEERDRKEKEEAAAIAAKVAAEKTAADEKEARIPKRPLDKNELEITAEALKLVVKHRGASFI